MCLTGARNDIRDEDVEDNGINKETKENGKDKKTENGKHKRD